MTAFKATRKAKPNGLAETPAAPPQPKQHFGWAEQRDRLTQLVEETAKLLPTEDMSWEERADYWANWTKSLPADLAKWADEHPRWFALIIGRSDRSVISESDVVGLVTRKLQQVRKSAA